jgi:hypothetical protein
MRQGNLPEELTEVTNTKAHHPFKVNLPHIEHYKTAFAKLLNDSGFSLTQAVYTVENAFLENSMPYNEYLKLISQKAELCREIITRNHLNPDDNLAKNYAIQQLYSSKTQVFDKRTRSLRTIYPYQYDFKDYRGDKDWTKMFVTKLLLTGKGQCHSMPLLYLILAEQLKAKASLALAPDHCYIQFPSKDGNLYNFETTQGKAVTDNAIMMSGFINSTAVKNKVYMDTLSSKQLLAFCLVDLAQGFIGKFGYAEFAATIIDKALNIDPNNIMALMMKADMKTYAFEYNVNIIGRPPIDKLAQYPGVYKLYLELQDLYVQIDKSGHQNMPPEAYQRWLQSLKAVQRERESNELGNQLKRNLHLQRSILKNKID